MPRINDTNFWNRRAALQADWQNGGAVLGRLTIEQRDALRARYLFNVPLRSSEVSSARSNATRRDTNLVGRAGLAYRTFAKRRTDRSTDAQNMKRPAAPRSLRATTRRGEASTRRVSVFSEVNRNVNPDQIARIIIEMARE